MSAPRFSSLIINERTAMRIDRGHLWVYSNEVVREDGEMANGAEVAVVSEKGTFLGAAVYNRQSLIRARIFARKSIHFDAELVKERITAALSRRERFMLPRTVYRAINGEADGLPGLIVDRYHDVLVIQISVLAMNNHRAVILSALREHLDPKAIVEHVDKRAQQQESFTSEEGVVFGSLEDTHEVTIDDVVFGVDLLKGLDRALDLSRIDNWKLMDTYAPGRRVLDLCSGQGGFSLRASKAGATSVRSIDKETDYLSKVMFNCQRNGVTNIRAKDSDAFNYVKSLPEEFDLIICDPPAFAKSKKTIDQALRQYRELTRQSMKMLTPGGILISLCSSTALSDAEYDKMLTIASKDAARRFRLLPGGGQSYDHAGILGMAETQTLKVRILEVVD